MQTYTEFFATLDWELQQEKETADTASADKFRSLPSTQAKRIIDETLQEMTRDSKGRFSEEVTLYFYDPATAIPSETVGQININLDTDVSSDTYTLTLPTIVCELVAYKDSNDYWCSVEDSSSNEDMYSPSQNTIYNSDGWEHGDELEVKIVRYPKPFTESGISIYGTITAANPTVYSVNTAHDVSAGDSVVIAGVGVSNYNTTQTVTAVTSSTITTSLDSSTFGNSSGGTITRDTDSDTLPTQIQAWEQLLILRIKERAYARKGKAMSKFEYSKMMNLNAKYSADKGKVKSVALLNFEGHDFGN